MAQNSLGRDDPADFLKSLEAEHARRLPDEDPAPPAVGTGAAPNTIDVKCQCGKTLRMKARLTGKSVQCPACQTSVTVPSPIPAESAAFLIDTTVTVPAANRSPLRRGSSSSARWLIVGGAVLVVCVPLVYFLAIHESPNRAKKAGASLGVKSAADDGSKDSEGLDDAVPPPREIASLNPVPQKAVRVNARKDPDPVATNPPAKKVVDPPIVVAKKQPMETPPAKTTETAKNPTTPTTPAVVVTAEKLDWLVGKSRTLTLHNGDVYDDVEVVSVRPGSRPRSLHSLRLRRKTVKTVRKGKQPPSPLFARLIHTIETPNGRLTLKYDKKSRLAVVDQVVTRQQLAAERAKRRAAIVARLRTRGHRIWPELSKEDHAKAVAEYKEFLITVGKSFTDRAMKFRETTYFLFYTNLPEAEVNLISKRLDAMYDQLLRAFGISRGKNIWRGKCVIVSFIHQQDFQKFEAEIMQTPAGAAVQGRAHGYRNGKCIIGCYRGTQFDAFAQTLVHETSHGFLHRHFSSVDIATWINEGIADWIADKVVPVADNIRQGQAGAVARVRTTHSLGGNFFTDGKIEPWQYGVASHLTEFMLRGGNGPKYRRFIDDIKQGYTWRESLKRNYGVDEKGLTTLYGRSLRIANLVP